MDSIRAIDLFCGAGGSSNGAKMAGVEIIAGFDIWEPAIKVFKSNFPEAKTFQADIRKLSTKDIKREIGEIDLILASPECTSHSIAKGAGKRSDESKNTAFEVIRFAQEFRPSWIIIENVSSIKSWDRYEELLNDLNKLNYFINDEVILNAKDFGVPQSRIRRFILCSLSKIPTSVTPNSTPKRTALSILDKTGKYQFTPLRKKGRAKATVTKAESAINELGREASFLLVYYGSGKKGNGGWQRLDIPLRTITTLDRFAYVVPDNGNHKMRMLQPEELKLAMGYSTDFMLESVEGLTRRDRVKLMGNGVCPPVMESIIQSLRN